MGRKLDVTVSELSNASSSFIESFAEAVAERLPAHAQETVTRAVGRFFDHGMESPVIVAIHEDAAAAREAIISGTFDGNAQKFVDVALERSAARVSQLFERDNVVPFTCRET